MRFGYAIFYVPDIEKTVHFYERAFGLNRRFIDESGNYAELETEGVTLAFAACSVAEEVLGVKGDGLQEKKPFSGMEIAFLTPNVGQVYAQALEQGATILTSPTVQPWGQTVAYVRDINGFIVELATPVM